MLRLRLSFTGGYKVKVDLTSYSDLITAWVSWMIARIREGAIERYFNYQHAPLNLRAIPFVGAYEEKGARGLYQDAIYPEGFLSAYRVEKCVVIHDDGLHLAGQNCKRVAVLVVRMPDWVFPARDVVLRYRVTLEYQFASNGNRWVRQIKVEQLGKNPQEVAGTYKVLKNRFRSPFFSTLSSLKGVLGACPKHPRF